MKAQNGVTGEVRKGYLVSGLSEAEMEALEDFRAENGLASVADALRDLARAGLVARRRPAEAPGAGFRWEDRPDGGSQAHAGSRMIGWVIPVEDERGVVWELKDVAYSKYLPPISGEARSVASAKAALRRAWTRWLAERGLHEGPAAGGAAA